VAPTCLFSQQEDRYDIRIKLNIDLETETKNDVTDAQGLHNGIIYPLIFKLIPSFEGGLQVNISNLEKINTIFSHCGEEDCSLSSFFEAFSWKVT